MPSIHQPRQLILVTCRENFNILGKEQEKDDIITIAWHMPTSFEPHLYAISVGKTRFSHELIKKSKAFVVNFILYTFKKEVLFCGSHSGKFVDKFKETKLEKEESTSVDCPRIKQALAYLECEVINEIETGDHTIFIGKVVKSEIKKKGKRLFQNVEGFTTTKN